MIIQDGRIINPMSIIRTKTAMALSALEELQSTRELLIVKARTAELLAPSAGTVYAVYRRPGEILKLAEEAMAISRDGESWATGHVPAASAPNIKPGQPVEIEIPSFGVTTKGIVQGIGHRAVYGRGGYTADFRGGPLDVPVRVAINHTSTPIPSGLRLEMTIRTRDFLKDFKHWLSGWQDSLRSHAERPATEPGNSRIDGAALIVPVAGRHLSR